MDSFGCPTCYCQSLTSAGSSNAEQGNTASDTTTSTTSDSSSGTPTYVPVVVALVALAAVVVGVVAAMKHRSKTGMSPWDRLRAGTSKTKLVSTV